ncbi:HlyD family secretion protein [Reyranella sp.]|uniref:HlyD family secretion protein n=1 Tax=Reyranella sp. TaxID=1929291 RepID=UPI003BAA3C35
MPAEQRVPDADAAQRSFVRRHALASGIALLAVIATGGAGYLYWDHARRFETTDDAFIAARQFAVAPKVSGYIAAVPVTDNQHVEAGALVARVDDRDYRVALDQAKAEVAAAEAGIENIDAGIKVQTAQIAANRSLVEQSEARLVFAREQNERYGTLAKEGWSSRQTGDLTRSELFQQQAAVGSARADLTVAQRQLDALQAQRSAAVARLREAKAKRDQARLNLSYTKVVAAQAGRVVQLGAAVGQFAQPGTDLAMFVPDQIWVTANFKETQLDDMRPGQPVTLTIDAYPERTIRGRLASVQPGSGTAFSLLPAENATGNYVKIVQRVPVKVIIDDPPSDVALGPGMSVEPSVRVDQSPSLYERLRAWL